MRNRWLLGIMILVGISAAIGFYWNRKASRQPSDQRPKSVSKSNDQPIPPRTLNITGIENPLLVPGEKSGLKDSDIVIGVTAFGESRAYLQSAFDKRPDRHIVNDRFGSVPISVVHCDRNRITRVFTSGNSDVPLDIRCGGWLADQELLLLVSDQEFAQSSKEIPLQEVDYLVTTWKEWRQAQPNSLVYLGQTTQ